MNEKIKRTTDPLLNNGFFGFCLSPDILYTLVIERLLINGKNYMIVETSICNLVWVLRSVFFFLVHTEISFASG